MKISTILITLAVAFKVLGAGAAELDCKKISNSSKRLICFDQESKNAASNAQEKERIRAQDDAKKIEADEKVRVENQAKEHEAQDKREALTSAKAAIKALKKVENRVEVGVSYRDYPSILSDATDAVREFQESKYAKLFPEANVGITEALKHYRVALTLWQDKFRNLPVREDSVLIGPTRELVEGLRPEYPDIDTAIYKDDGFLGSGLERLVYGRALFVIWQEASKSIARASVNLERS